MICGSILLFGPMIQLVIVSSVIAIFEPDKLSPNQFVVFVGESFMIYYMLIIPGFILFILGLYVLKKKKL